MLIGIDLGTTNSLAAVWRDGAATLVPNAFGDRLTPSVVGLSDEGTVLIGRAARDRLVTHPHMTAAAFKRAMGTDRVFRLEKRSFRAEELSSMVLRSLKEDAEAYLGQPIDEAVISVPAYFNDTQRKATRIAGQLAGLRVERLINEPTAAALAYGLHQNDETKFLVFDLGGGTFDVSVLELFDGIMEVHASAGDNFLGGEDFVEAIIAMFCEANALSFEQLPSTLRGQLRAGAERAKRELNSADSTSIELRVDGEVISHDIPRRDYEERVAPLLTRLRRPVERSMRDAGLRTADLSEVVLVGGSTRKTIVQRLVAQMFGRLPLRHINPDEVVALGAAVQAGLKMRDAALDDVVLTDVCPYTLGIEVSRRMPDSSVVGGRFSPIIERNTVIPTSRSSTFHPVEEGQRHLLVQIYQGESRNTEDNLRLGELRLKLPRVARDEAGVDVRFTYDVNGLLEVETTTLHTGQVNRLVIEQSPGAMSAEEIARRFAALSDLKVHPRDQVENQELLNRLQRLHEESLGADRARVADLIDQFMYVLDGQDPREIERARKNVEALVARLETELF